MERTDSLDGGSATHKTPPMASHTLPMCLYCAALFVIAQTLAY